MPGFHSVWAPRSLTSLLARSASVRRWLEIRCARFLAACLFGKTIAGEPHAGQAVLHDVERLDHHDTLAGPVAHRTRSLRALPRISAGRRQTVMVIHDAPKILL
jgi:hypothetical protein